VPTQKSKETILLGDSDGLDGKATFTWNSMSGRKARIAAIGRFLGTRNLDLIQRLAAAEPQMVIGVATRT